MHTMSALLNSSIDGSSTNLHDSSGRSFQTSFSAQSGAVSPGFHHSGTLQGLHNMHGSFNAPSIPGALASRNSLMNCVPSGGAQQPTGNIPGGRFSSNNLPVALSQIPLGSSHGHSGVSNRGGMGVVGNPGYSSSTNGVGGSIPGILPTSSAIGNRSVGSGAGVSPILGNADPRITSSMGGMVGSGNMGRNMNSGGGLSIPGFTSRLNLAANGGSGNLGVQAPNSLMSGMLQRASPQVLSMLGNSYTSSGGPLPQGHVHAVNNLRSMLNDVNPNDSTPFDINDFPQLNSRPNSAGGPQGQLGSFMKQGPGVSPIVQQNQEFSIQNEDFPALPGFKGGSADYGLDMHAKEQLHDNSISMMQSQHFSMGRSAGFNFAGAYSSHRQQQHTPSVSGGPPGIGLRPMNSPNSISSMGSYDQLMQQYQQQQSQSQFRLQQISAANQSLRDQGMKSVQAPQAAPDQYGLLGLLSVIRRSDPDLTSLALGIDLTSLGLNLNSSENLHKTFASPWSDEPAKGDPEFVVPQCYYSKQSPPLHHGCFTKFQLETLFYTFYSMPKDEAQLLAANELYNRGWFYHKDEQMWLKKPPKVEPLVKTNAYERGSYLCFNPNVWETTVKDNFVLHYECVEKRPTLIQ